MRDEVVAPLAARCPSEVMRLGCLLPASPSWPSCSRSAIPCGHRTLAAPTELTEDFADLNAYSRYGSLGKSHAHLTGGSMTATRKRIAILVGINQYTGGIPPLRNALHDIEVLGEMLASRFGFDVISYGDKEATKAKLTAQADKLSRTLTEQDSVLLYFAGHGIARSMVVAMDKDRSSKEKPFEGDFHLVPQDARLGDESSYWSSRELLKAVRSWPCRQSLLILDCCYAGQAALDARRSLRVQLGEPLSQEKFAWYEQGKASQLLASAAHDEQAADSDASWLPQAAQARTQGGGEHSPFAQALIDGLSGKAGSGPNEDDNDGIILATDLYRYIYLRLMKWTFDSSRFTQTPDLVKLDPGEKNREFYFQDYTKVTPDLRSIKELSARNPYRGLSSYGVDDERQFFGRDEAIKALIDWNSFVVPLEPKDINSNIAIITGPSGMGKSSLLFAGLVPRLLDDRCRVFALTLGTRGHIRTKIRELFRGPSSATPSHSTSSATPVASATSLPPVASAQSLPSSHSSSVVALSPPVAHPDHSAGAPTAQWIDFSAVEGYLQQYHDQVLVFVRDQMEDVLDNPPDEKLARAFWQEVNELCQKDPSRVRFIATLRWDYKAFFSTISKDCFRHMESMSRANMEEVIAGPAKKNGVVVAEDLLDYLVHTYYDTPNSLPLLSFVLERLYEEYLKSIAQEASHRSENSTIGMSIYKKLGGDGVGGIFAEHADNMLRGTQKKLSQKYSAAEFDRITKGLLWRFISSDKKKRRDVANQELYYPGLKKKDVDYIIGELINGRLLVKCIDYSDAGKAYYQLTHDYLVTGWPWLAEISRTDAWDVRHRVIRDVADAHNDARMGNRSDTAKAVFAAAWKNSEQLDHALEESRLKSICFNELEQECLEAAHAARTADEAARRHAEDNRFRAKAFGIGLVVTLVSLGAISGIGAWIVSNARNNAKQADEERKRSEAATLTAESKSEIAKIDTTISEVQSAWAKKEAHWAKEEARWAKEETGKANREAIEAQEQAHVYRDSAKRSENEKINEQHFSDWYKADFRNLSKLQSSRDAEIDKYRSNYLRSISCDNTKHGQLNMQRSNEVIKYEEYAKCLHSKHEQISRLKYQRSFQNYDLIVETNAADAYLFIANKKWCLPINWLGKVGPEYHNNCKIPQLSVADLGNPKKLRSSENLPDIVSIDGMSILGQKPSKIEIKCNFSECKFDKVSRELQNKVAGLKKSFSPNLENTVIFIETDNAAYYNEPDTNGKDHIYRIAKNGEKKEIIAGSGIKRFAISAPARRMLVLDRDWLKVFEIADRKEKASGMDIEIGDKRQDISSLSLSKDGNLAFVGFGDGTAVLIDVRSRNRILGFPPLKLTSGAPVPLRFVAIGPEIEKERKLLQVYANGVVVVRTISRK